MTVQDMTSLSEIGDRVPTVLAIGVFDGVHRGHQALLNEMVTAARAIEARPVVLTFFPHPALVLGNRPHGRYYLTHLSERVRRLRELGIELVITHKFDDALRQTRADQFVANLQRVMDLRQLWGGNFSLGYKREGDFEYLSRLGQVQGFSVHLMNSLLMVHGERVSSSRIRNGLASGDVEDVTACLGRPFRVSGEVVYGAQRGRTIGFPTANVDAWAQQLLPAYGVYATVATFTSDNGEQQRYTAATNVGVRPTVHGDDVTVEAHLLDFDGDLYGKQLRLDFIGRIRGERKFAGLDALKAQISADVAAVRAVIQDVDSV